MDHVKSNIAPKAVGPYPHAKIVGDLVFLSGMGPRKRGSTEIVQGIKQQTHSVFNNLKAVLAEMGLDLSHVVDVTVFLTNMKEDFQDFNKVYGEYFSEEGPARTTVEVRALPTPISVELKCIAYKI